MSPWTLQKLNLLLIFTFYYRYLIYIYHLSFWKKTVLFLICNRINSFVDSQCKGAKKRLVLHVSLRCGSLSITIALLTNEFDVQSVLHGQLSINFCKSWGYEQLQNCNESLKACSENVNIEPQVFVTEFALWLLASLVCRLLVLLIRF